VLALAAPVGIALTAGGHQQASVPAARPVTSWPDRSTGSSSERALADSAVIGWAYQGQGHTVDVHWLYRGVEKVTGGSDLYLAVFVSGPDVVVAQTERSKLDAKDSTADWEFHDQPASAALTHIGLYLPRLNADVYDDNRMLVLADPRARTMRWTATPVPFAPDVPDAMTSGTLTSDNGVFRGWTGKVTGDLDVAFDQLAALPGALSPLGFAGEVPQLVAVAHPDTPVGSGLQAGLSGGSGQVAAGDSSIGYADETNGRPVSVYVRCYGGGALTVTINDKRLGAAPCDDQTHVFRQLATGKSRALYLKGDRLQSFAFNVVDA
jgi:hypothetical protein